MVLINAEKVFAVVFGAASFCLESYSVSLPPALPSRRAWLRIFPAPGSIHPALGFIRLS